MSGPSKEQFEDRQFDHDDQEAHRDDERLAHQHCPTAQRQVHIDPRQGGQPYRMTRGRPPFDPSERPETDDQHDSHNGPGHHDAPPGATCPSVGYASSSSALDLIKLRLPTSCNSHPGTSGSRPGSRAPATGSGTRASLGVSRTGRERCDQPLGQGHHVGHQSAANSPSVVGLYDKRHLRDSGTSGSSWLMSSALELPLPNASSYP